MQKENLAYGELVLGADGKVYLAIRLGKQWLKFKGQKISAWTCFYKYNFCQLNLKRPHLTCFHCFLRRYITGETDEHTPLIFIVFPVNSQISPLRKEIIKKLVSFAEFVGKVSFKR
jgi:hypothetical protein